MHRSRFRKNLQTSWMKKLKKINGESEVFVPGQHSLFIYYRDGPMLRTFRFQKMMKDLLNNLPQSLNRNLKFNILTGLFFDFRQLIHPTFLSLNS